MLEEEKKEEVSQEYEVEGDDFVFQEENEEVEEESKVESPEEDSTIEKEQPSRETIDSQPIDNSNTDYEKLKSMYEESQKFIQKLGNEVGELRKTSNKANMSEDERIDSMDMGEITNELAEVEKELLNPEDPYSDDHSANMVKYQKLIARKTLELSNKKFESSEIERQNKEQLSAFKQDYPDLNDQEIESLIPFAKKMSENGRLSKSDIEVALFKQNPDKFKTYMNVKSEQNVRKSISEASGKVNNTLSTSDTNKNVSRVKLDSKLAETNPEKFNRLFKKLSKEDQNKFISKYTG